MPNSAKELEHYQRVRDTFEGPATHRNKESTNTSLSPRLQAEAGAYLHPPAPTSRPKLKSRTSTMKPATSSAEPKSKGKMKATEWNSGDDEDDDDDAYVTSNDSINSPERGRKGVNGAFGDVGADDDGDIYG